MFVGALGFRYLSFEPSHITCAKSARLASRLDIWQPHQACCRHAKHVQPPPPATVLGIERNLSCCQHCPNRVCVNLKRIYSRPCEIEAGVKVIALGHTSGTQNQSRGQVTLPPPELPKRSKPKRPSCFNIS